MYLTRVFLQRPTLVFVLIALTVLAAFMALRSLVVQQTPNSGLPTISVSVSYSGASTTDLVTEVATAVTRRAATVSLGIPAYRDIAAATITAPGDPRDH